MKKAKNYYKESLRLGNRKAADKYFQSDNENNVVEYYNFHISPGLGVNYNIKYSNRMNNSYKR